MAQDATEKQMRREIEDLKRQLARKREDLEDYLEKRGNDRAPDNDDDDEGNDE